MRYFFKKVYHSFQILPFSDTCDFHFDDFKKFASRERQYLKRVVLITHACLRFFLNFINFEDIRLRNHQYLKRVAHILKSGVRAPDPEPAVEKKFMVRQKNAKWL